MSDPSSSCAGARTGPGGGKLIKLSRAQKFLQISTLNAEFNVERILKMMIIDDFFDDNGPLAAVLGSYRRRDEQVRLARSVADTLRRGGVLLGVAPPGTGKCLAYLAPIPQLDSEDEE